LGRAIALICQRNERKIMQAKPEFTERCHLRVATDLFDGHLREIGDLDLEACSTFVASVTGFAVKFALKPAADTRHPWCDTSPSVTSATSTASSTAPTVVVSPSVSPATTTSTSGQVCTGFVSSLCCVGRLIDPPSSWCKVCTDFYLRTKYRFPRSFGDRSRPCLPESCDRFALLGDIRVCRDHSMRATLQSFLHIRWPTLASTVPSSRPPSARLQS
jgi:hypothetical protein